MDLKGKAAFVTGGAQGIGRAIAEEFLRRGMKVAAADSDEEAGREAQRRLRPRNRALFVKVDVADEESVRAGIVAALRRFGRLDVLVNNAGYFIQKPLSGLTRAEWDRLLAVNLTGMFLCAKQAAPYLKKSRGAIVNISSTRARMAEPGTEAYCASKGGVVGLTHALALSLGPEVRVNCISPGWIDTSAWKKSPGRRPAKLRREDHAQHPAGRVGRPEDVAALAAYLASPASGFMTGTDLVIDGGMTKKMIYV